MYKVWYNNKQGEQPFQGAIIFQNTVFNFHLLLKNSKTQKNKKTMVFVVGSRVEGEDCRLTDSTRFVLSLHLSLQTPEQSDLLDSTWSCSLYGNYMHEQSECQMITVSKDTV